MDATPIGEVEGMTMLPAGQIPVEMRMMFRMCMTFLIISINEHKIDVVGVKGAVCDDSMG